MSSSDSSSSASYSLNLLSMPLLQVVSNQTRSAANATVSAVSSTFSSKEPEDSVAIAPPQPSRLEASAPPAPAGFHTVSRSDTEDSIISEASDDAAPELITDASEASEGQAEAEFQAAPAYSAMNKNMLHGTPDSSSTPPTDSTADRSQHAAPAPDVEHGAGIGESGNSGFKD